MISISNKKLNFEELNLSGVFKIIKINFQMIEVISLDYFVRRVKDQNISIILIKLI